jgi:phospholipid/cholesterol/gamma-HCH transport system ATP-binding protein
MSEKQHSLSIEMCGVGVAAMRDPSFCVVSEVNWSVEAGDFWVIAGQEHSGKSDLLMMTAGLMPPAEGCCKLFGNDTKAFGEAELAERLRVGFVFQGGHLFNRLTIAENVSLPLQYQKDIPHAEATKEALILLELMELTPLADLTPSNVAANWRQRVALARALILKPEVLLLDNPLVGLGARHLQWWLHFLEKLSSGQAGVGSAPMTIVVTADDLRPWQNETRKFALLADKHFTPLGTWKEVVLAKHPTVRELASAPMEGIKR